MFIVAIPTRFESDLRRGRPTEVQVTVDATAMQQASIGAGHIKNILSDRIASFIHRTDAKPELPLRIVVRKEFNPNGEASWFSAIVALINQITTLTVVLTGAALIREREHGTIEHLLTLPLTPFEIAISKVWANGLVILLVVAASIMLVIRTLLDVPIAGSLPLFLVGVVLYLFFATALGLYLGTVARSMAQFALLIILVVIVLQLLSGGSTPVESQPALDAAANAAPPLASLRRLLAGHHLPRRRIRDRLAPVLDRRRHRPRLLRLQPPPIPPVHRRDQVAIPRRARVSSVDLTDDDRPIRCVLSI